MTKQEASQAINEGKKVSHRFFDKHEYIEGIGDNNIRTEDGFTLTFDEFMSYRPQEEWNEGWKIFQETDKVTEKL